MTDTLPSSLRIGEFCRARDQDVIDLVGLRELKNGCRRINPLDHMCGKAAK